MKRFITIIFSLFSALCLSAQTTLFQTDFSTTNDLSSTGSYNSELAQNDDYKEWMNALTYCVFENAGTLTLPVIHFPAGSSIKITWGIHDSGRTIELKDGENLLNTFSTTNTDGLIESSFDFPLDFTDDKTLTLSVSDGVVFITEIVITSDNSSGCNKNKLNSLNAWVEGKNLIVASSSCNKIKVDSTNGKTIYKGLVAVGNNIIPLSLERGVYFVKVGENIIKLLVK